MERFLFIIFFAVLAVPAWAQENAALDERNGFKDIKLGMPVDSIRGLKAKKQFTEPGNVFPSALYEVEHEDYATIGDIAVKKIELLAYRNQVYVITVVTEKDPRLMKALENVYGQATYDAKNNRYFWKSSSLLLTYASDSKRELKMEYKSFLVPQMMKDDKEKKIDNIADDF